MDTRVRRHYTLQRVSLWQRNSVSAPLDIQVEDGRVAAIGAALPVVGEAIGAAGLCLLPAGVDPQVHLRVPGQAAKETPATGIAAALAGGVGAMLSMPNTKPVIDSPEILRQAYAEMQPEAERTGVRVLFSAAITRGLRGQEATDYRQLAQAGAAAFTDDGVGVVADDLMRAVFVASAETGLPVLQHAEYPGHGGVLAAGPAQARLGVPPYPESAEVEMVARDLRLLRDYPGARYHVLHVSSRATLTHLARAKDAGLQATCEVSPHHLWLTADDVSEAQPATKMNPPLRSAADRQALVEGLASGLVDFVATDHAPHEAAVKTANLRTTAYGTTGLETSLRVLLTLYQAGALTAERLVAVFASAPARFLGLSDWGTIEVGTPLRACLVDTDAPATAIADTDLHSRSRNNCFVGRALGGRLHATILGPAWTDFSA